VFIGEILANMTQVSDVAPGPLVTVYVLPTLLTSIGIFIAWFCVNKYVQKELVVYFATVYILLPQPHLLGQIQYIQRYCGFFS
jgi:uncharacterized membrane protein YobD (UPF0266 family)